MTETTSNFMAAITQNHARNAEMLEKLLAVAQNSAVFGAPVTIGDQAVITAAEVRVGLGFGAGLGGSMPVVSRTGDEQTPVQNNSDTGSGGGGGGGGGAFGRPVAVIAIGPQGVNVQPVVDVTKIALAAFAMAGGMLMMRRRKKR